MQTSFHILSLVSELKKEIVGNEIVAAEFYKKERAAYFFFKKKKRYALAFLFHPTHSGTFFVPASKIKITTQEKPWPIFSVKGAVVLSVEQMGFDRIFIITIELDKIRKKIVFEVIGPNGNIWFLDKNNLKLATLRKKSFQSGDSYQAAGLPDKLNPLTITAETLSEYILDKPDMPLTYFIEKNILGCNLTLAREIIARAALDSITTSELNNNSIKEIIKTIKQLTSFYQNPETGYLYNIKRGFEAHPFKLFGSQQQPHRFKTLSLAVMEMTKKRQTETAEEDFQKNITEAVKRAILRLKNRTVNIESDIEQAANFELYRKQGELLQINYQSLKKGMDRIDVEDIFTHSHQTVSIKLDPSFTPKKNVERYFKKFRKGREGLDLLKRRLTNTKAELDRLTTILSGLENDFSSAQKRYSQELLSLIPKAAHKHEVPERLPYREYIISTGLRVFVGRDGSDNDRTTFEFAKPYELWFHAQQCPGSHVVLKAPNKSFEPSRLEIEETASIAAYFSKAKNNSLVPIVYTQRKYIRKPRKAKPGLVTVEREKSVMVTPKKPE